MNRIKVGVAPSRETGNFRRMKWLLLASAEHCMFWVDNGEPYFFEDVDVLVVLDSRVNDEVDHVTKVAYKRDTLILTCSTAKRALESDKNLLECAEEGLFVCTDGKLRNATSRKKGLAGEKWLHPSDAYHALLNGELDKDAEQLEMMICPESGETLAHVGARKRKLPAGFDRWALATPSGWTVAHEAARWRDLPVDFAEWHLTDEQGMTVESVALSHNYDVEGHRRTAAMKRWEHFSDTVLGGVADELPQIGF